MAVPLASALAAALSVVVVVRVQREEDGADDQGEQDEERDPRHPAEPVPGATRRASCASLWTVGHAMSPVCVSGDVECGERNFEGCVVTERNATRPRSSRVYL